MKLRSTGVWTKYTPDVVLETESGASYNSYQNEEGEDYWDFIRPLIDDDTITVSTDIDGNVLMASTGKQMEVPFPQFPTIIWIVDREGSTTLNQEHFLRKRIDPTTGTVGINEKFYAAAPLPRFNVIKQLRNAGYIEEGDFESFARGTAIPKNVESVFKSFNSDDRLEIELYLKNEAFFKLTGLFKRLYEGLIGDSEEAIRVWAKGAIS